MAWNLGLPLFSPTVNDWGRHNVSAPEAVAVASFTVAPSQALAALPAW